MGMYKYTKMIKDGNLNFLKKYKYDSKKNKDVYYSCDELELFYNYVSENNYPLDDIFKKNMKYKKDNNWFSININYIVSGYINHNFNSMFGEINPSNDIKNNKLSFVKSHLFLFDTLCSLYDSCELDKDEFSMLMGENLNYMLFLFNILKYEKLNYLDDYDRERIDLAFNYLFSGLTAIAIINHDLEGNFSKKMFNGNNDYVNILSDANIDPNNINYENEFNDFIYSYELNNSLNLKKSKKKLLKRY